MATATDGIGHILRLPYGVLCKSLQAYCEKKKCSNNARIKHAFQLRKPQGCLGGLQRHFPFNSPETKGRKSRATLFSNFAGLNVPGSSGCRDLGNLVEGFAILSQHHRL